VQPPASSSPSGRSVPYGPSRSAPRVTAIGDNRAHPPALAGVFVAALQAHTSEFGQPRVPARGRPLWPVLVRAESPPKEWTGLISRSPTRIAAPATWNFDSCSPECSSASSRRPAISSRRGARPFVAARICWRRCVAWSWERRTRPPLRMRSTLVVYQAPATGAAWVETYWGPIRVGREDVERAAAGEVVRAARPHAEGELPS
jgi:hypothetical protein